MQRITITVDDDLMADLDRMIETGGYPNRSEAIRDLARLGLREAAARTGEVRDCVGVLSYVYDHEARNLSSRLTTTHHHHRDISVAALHIHLDADQCLEISVLKGRSDEVQDFADTIISQRAVSYGELKIVPQGPRHDRGHDHDHDHDGESGPA
ncbi:nickel-responsive transcriptional regulator NikR [Fulvimarina endophytica]|uniref:Putative nickel-responsive regulator n=1 Tax=Fulvimarina endophytica TaxID=2293836 RepID=A0A371WZV2_9HYPH|nr:nickel-responsive transcriptional regulator NikR [Fulvimarina endophytica]RFC62502.1 nickel-responsive transcriptional regulator NikR [Fulvimarina endophytica]